MDFLREWLPWLPSIEEIIRWGGVIGIVAIVFAETGLLIGFFLPGDSLLVTAGIFAAMGDLSLAALLCLVSLAAIVGDAVGYRDRGVVAPPAVERDFESQRSESSLLTRTLEHRRAQPGHET